MRNKSRKTMWISLSFISICVLLTFLTLSYYHFDLRLKSIFAREQVGIFASMAEKARTSDIPEAFERERRGSHVIAPKQLAPSPFPETPVGPYPISNVTAKPFSRTLKGPFPLSISLISKPIGDSWIKISNVSFSCSNGEPTILGITYDTPEKRFSGKIRRRITATTRDGKKSTLLDIASHAPMGPTTMRVGSTMAEVGSADAITLPENLGEIVELKLVYIPEES